MTILDSLNPQIHGANPSSDSPLLQSVMNIADVMVGSVLDTGQLADAVKSQDLVVHLAAETGTGQSMYEIDRYVDANCGGTAKLLQVLSDSNSRPDKLIVASSRSIYGEGRYFDPETGFVYPEARLEKDLEEGRFEPTSAATDRALTLVATTEDSLIHPTSVYGITKHNQEALVRVVAPTVGIAPVALRYQNVYGPGQSLSNPYTGILSIFSGLIQDGKGINIFEDGEESRDFVYIDDVVDATFRSAVTPEANGQVFNVGSGVPTSVNSVVAVLQKALGKSVPVTISGNYRLGDIRHNYADIERARNLLGFEPQVSFERGVQQFADWVQTQRASSVHYERSLNELREKNLLK